MRDAVIVQRAQFDPKVKVYWFFQGLLFQLLMATALVGFITTPIWVLGFGPWLVSRRFASISAELTPRALHLRQGVLFKVEKTIPLEKIQDLSLRSGPLLSAFGLASIQVETAGGNAQSGADMTLAGVVDAEAFRDAVLAQRDRVSGRGDATEARSEADPTVALLTEIRDSLRRIEDKLGRG